MRAAQRKAPEPAGAGSGAGTSAYEKLPAHFNPDASAQYSELLRELQRVVSGMAATVDRMQARIAQAVAR